LSFSANSIYAESKQVDIFLDIEKPRTVPFLIDISLKGQCHEIFDFKLSTWISFPQAPDYTIRAVSNFLQKFVEIFAAQGAPPVSLTMVANENSFNQKMFIISFGHLWVVELAYRKFFPSSSF
jgi:hypothetical protein